MTTLAASRTQYAGKDRAGMGNHPGHGLCLGLSGSANVCVEECEERIIGMMWLSPSRNHGWKLLSLLLAILLAAGGCGTGTEPVRLQGQAIGTVYSIVVNGLPDGLSSATIESGIQEVMDGVNSSMSLFNPDSELSRFNDHQGSDWLPVSKKLAQVVFEAKEVSRMTGGAFDVTVAPLVNLWGFGDERRLDVVPAKEDIQAALGKVGIDRVEVRLDPPALRKSVPVVTIDLAAIAKGYCVDAVSSWLESRGVTSYLVEIGGEIRTKGAKPDGSAWRIAVEKPVNAECSVQTVIELTDKGMATSGDYRNYFEVDGKRYSHIISPTTGHPITHALASVSVIDASCTRADALATGLLVLGPEKGLELARKENLSAFFIVKTPAGFAEYSTGGFPQHKTLN